MANEPMHLDPIIKEFQAGNLDKAKRLTEELLQNDANNAEANHLMGVIYHRTGDLVDSLGFIQRSSAIEPHNAIYLNTQGLILRLLGRHGEAIQQLKLAIQLKPDYSDAYNNLGIAFADNNNLVDAERFYRKALECRPNFPEAMNNLGNILFRTGNHSEALNTYSKAVKAKPDYAEAYSNLGDAFACQGDLREACKNYQKAVEIAPMWADVFYKLGNCWFRLEDLKRAINFYRCCLNIDPCHTRCLSNIGAAYEKTGQYEKAAIMIRQVLINSPEHLTALKNLGHVLLKLGQPAEATLLLKKAVQALPTDPDAQYTLGNALLRMEKIQDAMECYKRVRQLQPSAARGFFAPASILLLNGQYDEGWVAYESRFDMPAFKPNIPDIHSRLWDGSPLNGRDLLVHVEQGFGDTLQFIRYIPKIAAERRGTGGKIKILCEPELHPVIKSIKGYDEIYTLNGNDEVAFDVQVPLLSLPNRFRTKLDTIPCNVPYLKAPASEHRPSIPSQGNKLNTGIVWAGRPTHSDDRYRSIPFKHFVTLFSLSETVFYSIQSSFASLEAEDFFEDGTIIDLKNKIRDFGDTADIIDQLDLVIACDTAVAHLAGALGKPVWLILPYGSEWRWLMKRADTPWYPTMRLFRQRICGDWQDVFVRVKTALSQFKL